MICSALFVIWCLPLIGGEVRMSYLLCGVVCFCRCELFGLS